MGRSARLKKAKAVKNLAAITPRGFSYYSTRASALLSGGCEQSGIHTKVKLLGENVPGAMSDTPTNVAMWDTVKSPGAVPVVAL